MYRLAKRCARGLALGVSRFGEVIGSDALTYNYGVFQLFHRLAVHNAPHFADAILGEVPEVTSIADIGCGSGAYAAEFKRRGVTVMACEYSPRGRRLAQRQGVRVLSFDLAKRREPLPDGPYDVAFSIEVAEHVPAHLAGALVQFMAGAGKTVVLTAATPGQGGQGHVNEQPREYWIEKFRLVGLAIDNDATRRISNRLRQAPVSRFLYANLMVFRQRQSARGNAATTCLRVSTAAASPAAGTGCP